MIGGYAGVFSLCLWLDGIWRSLQSPVPHLCRADVCQFVWVNPHLNLV